MLKPVMYNNYTKKMNKNQRSIGVLRILQKTVYVVCLFVLILLLLIQVRKFYSKFVKGILFMIKYRIRSSPGLFQELCQIIIYEL